MFKEEKRKFHCFLLIKVDKSDEHKIFNELSKLEQILEVHPLFGEWQLICRVDTDTEDEYLELLEKVKLFKAIIKTKSLVGFNLYKLRNKR